ncbi:MAG: hypothetical protein RLZZ127_2848 [Planctomycetota bacterium]|jgi:predicted RNase H-like HicB family nuclease
MLTITYDREADGRWIAEIQAIPGCMAYGSTQAAAAAAVESLALRICADRIDHGEPVPVELDHLFTAAP